MKSAPTRSRSWSMRCRCARSTAMVAGSSDIGRRPCAVFGSPMEMRLPVWTMVWTTRARPASRSMSVQRRPSASPRRMPVVASSTHRACSRSSAARDASRNARSVAASHACTPSDFWPARGGSAASAGLRGQPTPADGVLECPVQDRVHVLHGAPVEAVTIWLCGWLRCLPSQERCQRVLGDVCRLGELIAQPDRGGRERESFGSQ